MAKTDRCVVRNAAYQRGEFGIRERHNERKNENYFNGNVDPELAHRNVYYKQCEGGYEETFNKMVEDGQVSLRGLKADAKVFDEMIFAVNTDYFDRNGGYEYAKQFFDEAYKLAVKEIGDEQYVLSAVMHADEKNTARSEELGRDVFQYHLHVVYVPVVEKEVYYRKNNKNPELAGKLKEVITQVSHSKKWPGRVYKLDENGEQVLTKNGNPSWVNSYSLLQDRFFEHMQTAGFTDFERGERGSTAEHLADMEYKSQQEAKRAAELAEKADSLSVAVQNKAQEADTLDKQVTSKQKRLSSLDDKIKLKRKTADVYADIDSMAKKTIGGNIQLSPADWNTASSLAKEGQKSRSTIKGLREKEDTLTGEVDKLQKRLKHYGEGQSITETMRYHQAKSRAPRRLEEVITDIMRQAPEKTTERQPKQKSHDQEI